MPGKLTSYNGLQRDQKAEGPWRTIHWGAEISVEHGLVPQQEALKRVFQEESVSDMYGIDHQGRLRKEPKSRPF